MIDSFLEEAHSMRAAGNSEAAMTACQKAIDADTTDHRGHFLLGSLLLDETKEREAMDAFAEAVRLAPDDLQSLYNYSVALTDFGQFDKAKESFERCIEIDSDFSPAYYGLTNIVSFESSNPWLEKLENLAGKEFENDQLKRFAHFALAKAYDDIGEYDDAFEQYSIANKAEPKIYDHNNTTVMFSRAKEAFTPELMQRMKGAGNQSEEPAFIIGMPRSGSTLVEELLCRNPDIQGFSERPEAAQIVQRLEKTHPSNTPYPDVCNFITAEQFSKLGDLYLMLLAKIKQPSARTIDKNILNHSIAGFIRLMFPKAAIIHTKRDAIDTCLSCYFQNFRNGLEYTFDLTDLGKRYGAYAGLMDHWRRVMGDGLVEIQYEELVQDKEAHTARLFEAVGMPPPTGEEADTPTDRAIPTASAWQARQPIYTSSVKRWKNYEKHLGPLFAALESEGFHYEA